ASRAPAAHWGNERNLIIILDAHFTVNVLLVDGEGDRALKLRQARVLAAKLVPERADGGRPSEPTGELRCSHPLAQRSEEEESDAQPLSLQQTERVAELGKRQLLHRQVDGGRRARHREQDLARDDSRGGP